MRSFDEHKKALKENSVYFLKWTLISAIIGTVGGVIGAGFSKSISWVTAFRRENGWTLFLMPAAGVLIVWLYHTFHEEKNRGTNMVLEAVSSGQNLTVSSGLLIFISTVLTHFVGGSSGREGAALQLGGSIGSFIGKKIVLDDQDRKIAVMCGMSAVFGALFGTPVAAGIFSMEAASIGTIYYAGFIPCLFASFLGASIAEFLGASGERFSILSLPEFNLLNASYVVLLGILCALVSIGFCMLLHLAEKLYRKKFQNPYRRILAASAVFIVLTLLSGSRIYNGSSMELIEQAMEGHVQYEAFLLKAIFTAVALGAGFKGGEIVPTLCVGATFGCMIGQIFGISPSFSAACGMTALFVGVTNCPISSLVIALELFGGEAIWFFALITAVSFALSGYYGLYSSQQFVFSKTRQEVISQSSETDKNEEN